MGELTGNRTYKDTVFKDLFGAEERKANALALYNALAGTSYDDPEELELTTLGGVLYLNMRNDVSFLVGEEMVLWEHQSTRNANMPLRGLVYFGRLYSSYVEREGIDIYSTALRRLPRPRYYVFYNGTADEPAEKLQRLSDAYLGEGAFDVEVRATVVNVNAGSGASALAACEPLAGYAELVARVRYNQDARGMGLAEAIDDAIASCIRDGYLADYLRERRAEVKDMFMTEYDEVKSRELARKDGYAEGLERGARESTLADLGALMDTLGLDAAAAMDALKVPEADRAALLAELGSR